MLIRFKIKRTVLLSALKVLQQVLPFSRKAQEGIMMEMKIRNGQVTMRCTVASVTLPCECEGESRIVVALNYFKRIVEDNKAKFFDCTCEDNVLRYGKKALSGFKVYQLTKGTDFEPESNIPSEPKKPKH